MSENEIMDALREKLDKCNEAYRKELLQCSPFELIERAREIDANALVYNELHRGEYLEDFMEYLLRFQNPLEVVRDQWLNEQDVAYGAELYHALWTIADKGDAEQEYELDEAFLPPDQKVEMC